MSTIKYDSTDPVWNESFYFFIRSPETAVLSVKLQNELEESVPIETLEFAISQLFNEDHLELSKDFEFEAEKLEKTKPKLSVNFNLKVYIFFSFQLLILFWAPSLQ